MDFALRCNSLKCRIRLADRAVVTTCSHVFCNECSDALDLSAAASQERRCPACQSTLRNPDDVVSTSLNPTDDYKTSVLSGLHPSIIMECAGRALAFWSYQSTQEIVYQEYLAKTLRDKSDSLSLQMDKIVSEATSELEASNQRLRNTEVECSKFREENAQLAAALREKTRKQQQTQELYDRIKRKEMAAVTQSAAFNSVDEALGRGNSLHGTSRMHDAQQDRKVANLHQDTPIISRSSTTGAPDGGFGIPNGSRAGEMGPPPRRQPQPLSSSSRLSVHNSPSLNRARLGATTFSPPDFSRSKFQNTSTRLSRSSPRRSYLPSTLRSPEPSVSEPGHRGYGMSAGIKIGGRQVPSKPSTGQGDANWW